MSRAMFVGSMLLVSAVAVGGYAASQFKVRAGRVGSRVITDEPHAARRSKPVSDSVVANLGPIGLMDGALLAFADPAKATDMGTTEWENTAAVVVRRGAAASVSLGGRKTRVATNLVGTPVGVVSTGQTVTGGDAHGSEFRVRPLDGTGALKQVPISVTKIQPIKITQKGVVAPKPYMALGTDNQIVKLKDGSLLAVRNVISWESVAKKPAWWDKVQIQGSPNGARVGTMVWHSTDGESWTRRSFVDPLNYEDGRYAVPRPVPQEPAGCPSGCYGGWDRVEAYACPFTGDVYLNLFATGGYLYDDKTGAEKEKTAVNNLLFKSVDGGKTFQEVTAFWGWTPVTMTTTPDGRLWLFSVNNGTPTIWFTTKNQGMDVKFDVSYPVELKQVSSGVSAFYGAMVYKETNCISRVSTDASTSEVRVAYHYLDSKGKTALAVANVAANGPGAPKVSANGFIRGSGDAEVLACAFLDGDAEGFKVSPGTAALYWVEGSGTLDAGGNSKGDGSMVVKARVYRGPKQYSPSVAVSQVTSPTVSIGHYMGGGSFVNLGKLHFAPQWSDHSRTWMNVVSMSK